MSQFLAALLNIAVITFAVTSMLSVGLAHSFNEVLAPLRNIRGVLRALVANFVLVPLAAYLLTRVLTLDRPLEIGLLLVGLAAGAPFLIKLTAHAEHNVAMSATLLVLLLPATVIYMPLVVPLLLSHGYVSAGAIAMPLVTTMLLPMVAGLFLNRRSQRRAQRLQPIIAKVSSIALVVLIVATVLLNLRGILGVFGTGAILAALVLILAAFAIGYAMGGPNQEVRGVVGLATAQRNIGAATVVATQGIEDPSTVVMVVISSLVGLAILFPIARLLRRRLAKTRGKDAPASYRPDQPDARPILPRRPPAAARPTYSNRPGHGESLWKRTRHAIARKHRHTSAEQPDRTS